MCDAFSAAMAVMGGAKLGGSLLQGYAQGKQGEIEAKVAEQNAGVADAQAADAEGRGAVEVGRVRRAGSEAVAGQRVALGASGVDMQSGSALDMLTDTRALNELDARTAQANAAREAWGHRVQATQYRGAAVRAKLQAKMGQAGTLLGAIGDAAGMGAMMKGKG